MMFEWISKTKKEISQLNLLWFQRFARHIKWIAHSIRIQGMQITKHLRKMSENKNENCVKKFRAEQMSTLEIVFTVVA